MRIVFSFIYKKEETNSFFDLSSNLSDFWFGALTSLPLTSDHGRNVLVSFQMLAKRFLNLQSEYLQLRNWKTLQTRASFVDGLDLTGVHNIAD